jgi:hypothetical protein
VYILAGVKLSTLFYWLMVAAGIIVTPFLIGGILLGAGALLFDLWNILTRKPRVFEDFSEGFWVLVLIGGVIFVVFHFHIVEWG